jgi:hypothetical protein
MGQMQIEAEYVTVPKEVRERALEEADLIEREVLCEQKDL